MDCNNITEWDILKVLEKRQRWFTVKELILEFGFEINQCEKAKFCRKLGQLARGKFIKQRVCKRNVAWYREYEYKWMKTIQ